MNRMPVHKYRPFPSVELGNRTWPDTRITTSPIWCSVDLRDGNQALIDPMDSERKLMMFQTLVALGFKEIEVGFPAASATDFDFVRLIIEEDLIPDDVTIQVLTQARRDLIERSYESLVGAREGIMHLYNSTSTTQRRVVFGLDEAGIVDIAVKGAEHCKEFEAAMGDTRIRYEYSPESFTGTELPFAKEVCEAVMDVFEPTPSDKVIINLPATVEMSTANLFGDMIEWMHTNLDRREAIVLSVHPHNDRGTAVAAAEFGVMAGADRVEGTLFGNGERTGNVDVVTLALNLFTQGVDPGLDLSDINEIRRVAEHCNQLPVHPRHPYVGDLVYTAFSGSHQDAIKKGFEAQEKEDAAVGGEALWDVPYLPLDPADLGRSYEDVIRVNSQSGKGGVAYVLKTEQKMELPRRLQIDFMRVIQSITDETGREIQPNEIWTEFRSTYVNPPDAKYRLIRHTSSHNARGNDRTTVEALIEESGEQWTIVGEGNGAVDAFVAAVEDRLGISLRVMDYHEHAMGTGRDAEAVTYLEMRVDDEEVWGVGLHSDITTASLRAVMNAVNRHI